MTYKIIYCHQRLISCLYIICYHTLDELEVYLQENTLLINIKIYLSFSMGTSDTIRTCYHSSKRPTSVDTVLRSTAPRLTNPTQPPSCLTEEEEEDIHTSMKDVKNKTRADITTRGDLGVVSSQPGEARAGAGRSLVVRYCTFR